MCICRSNTLAQNGVDLTLDIVQCTRGILQHCQIVGCIDCCQSRPCRSEILSLKEWLSTFACKSENADRQDWYILISFLVEPSNLQIENLNVLIPEGQEWEIICTVEKIRPLAKDFYWVIDGVKFDNGTITNETNDNIYKQTNKLKHVYVYIEFRFFKVVLHRSHG